MKNLVLKASVRVKNVADSFIDELKNFIKGTESQKDLGASELVAALGMILLVVAIILIAMALSKQSLGSGTGTGTGGTGLWGAMEEKMFSILD